MELGNNAYFWQKLDTLYFSSDLVIEIPKGTTHKEDSDLVYPVSYGYLKELGTSNERYINVFKGENASNQVDAIVVCADILKKDIEVKLLIGCNEEEVESILVFLNKSDFQKAIYIKRGNSVPEWAINN